MSLELVVASPWYRFRGALACLALAVLGYAYGCESRKAAHLSGELAARDSVLAIQADSLARRRARVDTVHRTDSLTFVKWRTAYDTTHDTVTVDRVVYVKKETADSTLAACSETLASCELRRAIADAQRDTERQRRETAERQLATYIRADRLAKGKWGAVGVAVGYGACKLLP